MKHAKFLAIVAVAVFCISAFAVAINDDSSADDSKLTYSFYLELRDGSHSYSKRLADVTVNSSIPGSDAYTNALIAAGEAAGLDIETSYGYVNGITAEGYDYVASPYADWGTASYYNFAVYYYDKEWKLSNLDDSTMLVIVFDKYAFSEPKDTSKYYKNEFEGMDPYWTVLPTVEMVEYAVYFQLNDGDYSFSKWVKSTQPGISGESLKSARALGAKEAGFTVENNAKYATSLVSITADGHKYAAHGTYGTADYYNFSGYCKNGDENEWKDIQSVDLESATIVAHTFDNYKFADPQDDSYYYHAPAYGMDAYWTKAPGVSPSDADAKGSNMTMYIIIGAVVVIVIIVVAVLLVKKNKA